VEQLEARGAPSALVRDHYRGLRLVGPCSDVRHLVGTIEDAQGAVLPGVTVTVTSPQLQGANSTVTDANGSSGSRRCLLGVYHVKAELAGSSRSTRMTSASASIRRSPCRLKMQLAGVTETVNVLGSSPVVDHDIVGRRRERRTGKCSTSSPCAATSTR